MLLLVIVHSDSVKLRVWPQAMLSDGMADPTLSGVRFVQQDLTFITTGSIDPEIAVHSVIESNFPPLYWTKDPAVGNL